MALRFLDSCDHYATGDITKKWTENNGAFTINTSNGRFGGSCIRSGSEFIGDNVLLILNPQAAWVVGTAVNFGSIIPNTTTNVVQLLSTGVFQVGWGVNLDGTISIISGGNGGHTTTVLATSTLSIPLNTYNYIEFKATINTSISAHTCQVMLNGQLACEAPATSNTDRAATGTANSIALQFPWSSYAFGGPIEFDDIYICDGTGSSNNNFLGDLKCVALFPNGNGSTNQFTNDASNSTNNYSHVNADPATGAAFVESNTASQVDLYTFGSLPFSGTVHGIQQVVEAKKDNAGSRVLAPLINIAATNYPGNNIYPTSSYIFYLTQSDTNPNTSAAWTTTDVNNAQYGLEIVS